LQRPVADGAAEIVERQFETVLPLRAVLGVGTGQRAADGQQDGFGGLRPASSAVEARRVRRDRAVRESDMGYLDIVTDFGAFPGAECSVGGGESIRQLHCDP
jgi:hypothetical protein